MQVEQTLAEVRLEAQQAAVRAEARYLRTMYVSADVFMHTLAYVSLQRHDVC
jgi:hypothetical protein